MPQIPTAAKTTRARSASMETCPYDSELRLRATPELQNKLQGAGIDLDLATPDLYKRVVDAFARYGLECLQSLIERPAEKVWAEYIV